MATNQTIKIKRTSGDTKPTTVEPGEIVYAYDTAGNGGTYAKRLFIGDPTTNTNSPKVIGGEFFTEMLDHTAGTLTASSALIVDSSSKLNNLKVDNLDLDGNAITSTNTNGDITITPNGTGDIVLDGQNWPQADGSANQYLKTDGSGQLSWDAIPSGTFTLSDNQSPVNTDSFTTGNTLTFAGGTGLISTVSNDQIEFKIADGGVDTTQLAADAVNGTKIADDAINSEHIANGSVDNVHLAGSIANGKLSNSSITVSDGTNSNAVDLGDTLTIAGGDAITSTHSADQISLAVAVDGSSIEVSSDALQVKAGGITNSMLAGSIANGKLSNSSITIGSDSVSLGSTQTDLNGITSLDVDNITIDGNAITSTNTNGDITITPNGTGSVVIDGLSYPQADGSANQFLQTDGAGNLSFAAAITTDEDVSVANLETRLGELSGAVNIGASGSPEANFTFVNDVTITGDLTVNGDTTTVSSTNTVISDTLLELANGTTGTPANDSGIVIERGTAANAFIGFDESADKFTMGTGTFTGASTGNLSITAGTLVANLEGDVTGDVTGNLTGDVTGTVSGNAGGLAAGSVTESAIAVGTDYMFFFDGGASGTSAKESVADFITAIAGTNISATSGVLSVATATTSTLGLASFNSTQFDVSSGAVTLDTIDGGTYS